MKTNKLKSFHLTLGSILFAGMLFFAPQLFAQNASTNFWTNIPKGPQVHGYFEGRSPCREIADMLGVEGRDSCIKIKRQLVLFQDPITRAPTTYALGGFEWRNPPRTGKWTIIKGIKGDPNAVVYQLEPDNLKGFLSFLKADENILLFLDKQHNPLVGNSQFSYTLNRTGRL